MTVNWYNRSTPLPEPDVVLDGSWIPCPSCGAWRCTSCDDVQTFTPFDPPREVVLDPADVAACLDAVVRGGGELTVGGCRVEVDSQGPHHLVDRRDPRCVVISSGHRWPWRKALQEATRRR